MWRTCGVGRSNRSALHKRSRSTFEKTRRPSPSTSRASAFGETDPHARERSCRFKRYHLNSVVQAGSCTDASFSAVFRYPLLGTSRPGRASGPSQTVSARWLPPNDFHRSRRTALMGFYPSQVYSRRRVARHFCRPGPTCRLRCSSAPVYFRRGDRSPDITSPVKVSYKGGRPGTSFQRRLLGFAPVSDPCPPTTQPSAAFRGAPILPWALPLAGYAGA